MFCGCPKGASKTAVSCSAVKWAGFHKERSQPPADFFLYGAGNEARTRYLHLGKVALYQMSYAREQGLI